ncbi:hypothetical protein A2U01_0088577, partial [Trifolium medium]|nr:hypothetical protein [Trifolium medium]
QDVIPDKEKSPDQGMVGNETEVNTCVLSKSNENLETASEHTEKTVSVDKNDDADENVIDVDNLNSEESPAETTMTPSISK